MSSLNLSYNVTIMYSITMRRKMQGKEIKNPHKINVSKVLENFLQKK
jgi:hypothetical protein